MLKTFNSKKFNIYTNLYSSYGVGKKTITNIYLKLGINNKTRPKNVKKNKLIKIFKILKKKLIGKRLKKYVKSSIKHYLTLRTCKGIRHSKNYPIRGQRTHTNAKTKKKLILFK